MEKSWIPYSLVLLLIIGPMLIIVYRQKKRKNRMVNEEKNSGPEPSRQRFRFPPVWSVEETSAADRGQCRKTASGLGVDFGTTWIDSTLGTL